MSKNNFIKYIDEIDFYKTQLLYNIEEDVGGEEFRHIYEDMPNPFIHNIYFDDGEWSFETIEMVDGENLYILNYGNKERREFLQIDVPNFQCSYKIVKGKIMTYFMNEDREWLILNNSKLL